MRLYEINRALLDVIESGYSVDEETGEILFDGGDLERLEAARDEKLEACALYVKGLQAEADAIKAERDELTERLKAKERKAERMRAYMLGAMEIWGIERFERARVDVRARSSQYVDVYDADLLPDELVRRKVTAMPDKVAIKKMLKGGQEVAGAQLARRVGLTIK